MTNAVALTNGWVKKSKAAADWKDQTYESKVNLKDVAVALPFDDALVAGASRDFASNVRLSAKMLEHTKDVVCDR